MNIDTRIVDSSSRILIGMSEEMSLISDKTGLLFRRFMPRRKEITHLSGATVFDLKVYPKNYFRNFSPATTFTKWALAEVSQIENAPPGMETFQLEGGQYAVFYYQGSLTDNSIYNYIYSDWLVHSKYQLDDRPHFDIISIKEKLNDPNAEQEIWVPIKL